MSGNMRIIVLMILMTKYRTIKIGEINEKLGNMQMITPRLQIEQNRPKQKMVKKILK